MRTDKAYEYDINLLIPLAVKEARAKASFTGLTFEKRPAKLGGTYNHCFYTEYFHRAMKRLAVEAGLRRF